MLSILRTRAVALSKNSAVTRFRPALPTYSRTLSSTTLKAFANSHASRQYEEGRRSGFNDRYDSSPRQSARSGPRPPRNAPTSTIWVGNLPFTAVPARVEELFSEFGSVVSVRLGKRSFTLFVYYSENLSRCACPGMSPTGESKGFAHVDLADVASAEAIMQANAESQFFLDGRGLNLDYAGPPASRAAFPPSNTLHFSSYSGDETGLRTALGEFISLIKNIRISKSPFFLLLSRLMPIEVRNPQTGETNRFGFIECNTQTDATTILEKFNGKEVAYGETLALSYARGRRTDSLPPRHVDRGGDGYGFGVRGRSGGEEQY